MKLSVICPVKNEAEFAGFAIMSVLPYIHEIVLACAPSTDGTDALLDYIKATYAGDKLRLLREPRYDWSPHDTPAYNAAYNDCIAAATGDAVWFLHMDMICTNPEAIATMPPHPLAWFTRLTSLAGDFETVITKGRATEWKNIHAKKFGLTYHGAYGSQNEDFYHTAITGKTFVHHGSAFNKYPFIVGDSGLRCLHLCEMKGYKRRFEKMVSCLKNLNPGISQTYAEELAAEHPRVTLAPTSQNFGEFAFEKSGAALPEVITKYGEEFRNVVKNAVGH
jgi:glycosyltransferase involved in cell wall biosynthesis